MSGRIEHADALKWLERQEPGSARVVCFDPPYARGTPMRGREDGMAGSVYEPFEFLHDALMLSARALLAPSGPKQRTEFGQLGPYGIVICFCDWELLLTLGRLTSMSGLRQRTHMAWIQDRPGGGRTVRRQRLEPGGRGEAGPGPDLARRRYRPGVCGDAVEMDDVVTHLCAHQMEGRKTGAELLRRKP